jgi:hypothetical protein
LWVVGILGSGCWMFVSSVQICQTKTLVYESGHDKKHKYIEK